MKKDLLATDRSSKSIVQFLAVRKAMFVLLLAYAISKRLLGIQRLPVLSACYVFEANQRRSRVLSELKSRRCEASTREL